MMDQRFWKPQINPLDGEDQSSLWQQEMVWFVGARMASVVGAGDGTCLWEQMARD